MGRLDDKKLIETCPCRACLGNPSCSTKLSSPYKEETKGSRFTRVGAQKQRMKKFTLVVSYRYKSDGGDPMVSSVFFVISSCHRRIR